MVLFFSVNKLSTVVLFCKLTGLCSVISSVDVFITTFPYSNLMEETSPLYFILISLGLAPTWSITLYFTPCFLSLVKTYSMSILL